MLGKGMQKLRASQALSPCPLHLLDLAESRVNAMFECKISPQARVYTRVMV